MKSSLFCESRIDGLRPADICDVDRACFTNVYSTMPRSYSRPSPEIIMLKYTFNSWVRASSEVD